MHGPLNANFPGLTGPDGGLGFDYFATVFVFPVSTIICPLYQFTLSYWTQVTQQLMDFFFFFPI